MILNNSKLLIGAAVLTAIGFGTMQSAKALPLSENGLIISQTSTSPTPLPSRVTSPSQANPSGGTAPSTTNPTNENNTPSDGSSGSMGGSMGGSGGSMQDTTPSGATPVPSRVTSPSQASPSGGAAPSETNPTSGTSPESTTVRARVDQIVGSDSVRVTLPDGTKRLVTVKDPNVFSQLAPGDTVILTMQNDQVVDVARAPMSSSSSSSSSIYQRRTTTTTTTTRPTPQPTTTETTTTAPSQPAPVRALW